MGFRLKCWDDVRKTFVSVPVGVHTELERASKMTMQEAASMQSPEAIAKLQTSLREEGQKVPETYFSLYYGYGTWVVCNPDGSLETAFDYQPDADLRADLLNFLYFGE